MGQIIADTNIFIYLLKNVLSFPKISIKEIDLIKELINNCNIIHYSEDLKDDIIFLRRKYRLRIPDVIIAATALAYFIPLITADRNFRRIREIEISIYTIS
jgi:predicted nucleic acid-binding protein